MLPQFVLGVMMLLCFGTGAPQSQKLDQILAYLTPPPVEIGEGVGEMS